MIVVEQIEGLRAVCERARLAGHVVGFVPTMGSFHEGHRALMRAAKAETDFVVVSLFVNPIQFGPGEDLDGYPRDPDGDAAIAADEGVDVLFTPSTEEMYPDGPEGVRTTVHVAGLTAGLCGRSRPGHFDGVATVVAKLCSIVGACRAYFGRKDAQQLVVVRRMVSELALPVEVVSHPIVREPDGVAASSRNVYLRGEERRAATVLYRALRVATDAVVAGERDPDAVRALLVSTITSAPGVRLDYAEVVGTEDLEPLDLITGGVLLAVATYVGRARLIDNAAVVVAGDTVTVDLGVPSYEARPAPLAAGGAGAGGGA